MAVREVAVEVLVWSDAFAREVWLPVARGPWNELASRDLKTAGLHTLRRLETLIYSC